MPKYKVNGRTFNIPDNEVDLFEADFPEAQLHYQTNDGRKFTIYANERKDFLSDFPDATELGWSETIKEQAKQADPFQPEDNLAQPMYGSMSYQDNIGKPEDSLYYPSPLSEEGRADYEPITAEERSKKEYDMLMRQLNDFDAQNRDFMDTYEAYEKAAKHQVNEGGFALDTIEREYVNANSNDYHLRKQERDALNDRIKNNSYFNQMRMAEADAANETVDAISNLMAQNEAENTELHKKMKAMNALAMNPRGSFSGFAKTKEMQEYIDERADLETAKRLYENTAQVYAAPINDGEDILKKFGKGFGQRVDDADFWSMGIVGIADDMNARAAFQKIQDKFGSVKEFANLTDAEIDALLTPSEQLLISAVMDNNAALYARKDNTAGAYEAGAGAADSLMFMAQFLLTGGIGDAATVGTAAHRRLVNWLGRKVGSMSNGLMKNVARGAVKLGVGTAESIGKALVMTPLMPHTYANIADNIMSFDDKGELMDVTDAILTGAADALIETWSESTGDFVNKVLGVPGDITKGIAKKALKNVDFSDWGRMANAPIMKILRKGGFNGFLGEMGEEFIGNAVRSISGLEPDAFKEFTKLENLLVTAGSFAPMTIFGLGVSGAQYGWQKRKLDNAQKAFEAMLREASYTEDQARFVIDELLGSTDAHLTPEKLVANFSPLLRELAFNDKFANNRTQALNSAIDLMWQIARYRTFDGVYHKQEEQQRNDMLAEIQEGTGREFWTTRLSENVGLDGTAYEADEVRAVEFNDGRVAYVLGGDGVNNTVVYNDGQTGFLSEEQLNEGKANGSIVSDATMGLNDYLTQQVARVRMTEEEQRMFTERNTNIGQVRAQFPIDATVELGTTEAPIQGVVRQQTPNGVIVESPAGISQLTWEELGHTIGVEVNPQTDAQMEEEAINNLEIADLQRRREREQRRAQRNTQAEAALEAEQMLDEAENEGLEKPIPMKADGTVDQTAFWNESPARWAQWKTEQRQDGGAYASSYIQNAIGILEGQIAESEAAFLAESDFDAKDALEQTINQQRARLAELQDLAMQYMPSVIPAETSTEAAEETSPAAQVMAERQKFELDAEYQRRLSLARALAEKEMILKEYFEAISAGSMEAVVMNKKNYKQIMKDMGCDESAIEEVTNAIKEAEEEHTAVNALHVNDKIFVIAEYNYTVEQGRVSYVHERQHNITKRNPELIQRVLSLGLSRETLQKIVKTLSGTDFYDNKSDEVLADEILSSTMEIAYTFDDFSVTLSKLGIPIELINLINEINDEQRNDYSLANARRNTIQRNDRQGSSRQDVGDQGEVSGGILGEEGNGSQETGLLGAESGEPATGGAEASEEGLQVPVAEVGEESEEEPKGPDFRITKPEDPNGVTPEQIDEINRSVGGELEIGDEDAPVRFSVTAIGEGAGLTILKDDGEGNVAFVLPDGRRFNANNLLKPEDIKSLPNTVLGYMMKDAKSLGNVDSRKEWMLWNKYTLMLNAILLKGSAENGGFDTLSSQWQWIGDTIYKTVAINSDSQYSFSLDITRVCKKNEAVINAIAEMQARLGYGITPGQIMDIYLTTSEEGYQVPCPVCYVFSRYIRNGKYATIMINGQRKYGSELVDPRSLTPEQRKERIKFWQDELKRIKDENKAHSKEIAKANSDITTLLDEIDKIAKELTNPENNFSEEEKAQMMSKIYELDARYKAALNVVSQASLDSWITQFAIHKVKVDGKEQWVLYEDSYMGFPEEMALDLRQTSTVMRKYPAIQRFRNSRGAAAGKEITFVANNDLGDVPLALGSSAATKDLAKPREMSDEERNELQEKEYAELKLGVKNLYQRAVEETDPKKKKKLLESAKKRFTAASVYAKQQSLRGGQRMWSWSDNIERLAPDVFVNLLQLEMLGGALQSYSKQLEGIKLVASMNGYVNGSLMGKGNGYREVTAEQTEEVDGQLYLKDGDFIVAEPGKKPFILKTPVYQHTDGKLYVLEFDDVVGIDPFGKEVDGKHMKGLFELNAEYDRAGNIIVGMNDLHIRMCMADDRIFFIIPWHSSGANSHILAQMYEYLGVEYDVKLSQDYTDVQSEKRYKAPTEAEEETDSEAEEEVAEEGEEKKTESNKISQFLVDFWNDHYENAREYAGYGAVAGKDFACGIEGGVEPSDGNGNLSASQIHYRELRDAIFVGVKVPNGVDKNGKPKTKTISVEEYSEEWFNEIMNDAFLSQVYTKVRALMGDKGMTSADTKAIYPYEYWDESSTYDTADINGARYLEYCRRLGYKPKFCGKLDGKPESDHGNFTDDKGYWKVLIDRRMYAISGRFQDLTPVTADNFTPDLVDPEVTKEEFIVTRVADEAGTQTIVDKAIAREESRPGGIAKVDYDMTLNDALEAYNNGDVRMRVSSPSGVIDLIEEARKAQAKHDTKEKKGKKSDVSFRITAEQDKAYMDAVKAGDMETAQRMVIEAAKLAMPNTKVPGIVYHGTRSTDGEQPYNTITAGHFTDDYGFAEFYANAAGEGFVYNTFLNIEQPLVYDFKGQNSDNAVDENGERITTFSVIERARKEGSYDGVILKNVDEYGSGVEEEDGEYPGTITDIIPFSPSQIKSADPVTYDNDGNVIPLSQRFNPENEDIRFRFTPRTDEQREQLFDKAKAHYGLTNNFNASGYMLPDGSLLDFSEANDGGDPNRRSLDHRDIEGLIMDEGKEYDSRYHYVVDFVDEGAIRMLPEAAGFQLSVPPTAEQRSRLMDYIYKHNGEVIMEITDENGGPRVYMEYNKRTSPSRIFKDMDGYFNDGTVPGIPPIRFRVTEEQRDEVQFRVISDALYEEMDDMIESLVGASFFRRVESEFDLGKKVKNFEEFADLVTIIKNNDNYISTGSSLLGFFSSHTDQHFPLLLSVDDKALRKQAEADLKEALSRIDDTYILFYIKEAWKAHKNGLAQAGLGVKPNATAKFNKAIDARIEEIRAGRVKGTSFNFKKQEVSLDEIDTLFKQLNTNEELAVLHDKVMDLAKRFGIKPQFAAIRGAAEGESLGDKVRYDYRAFNSPAISDERKANIITHELIHSVTSYAFYLDNYMPSALTPEMREAINILREVYYAIRRDSSFKDEYGASSVEEMVAELSNTAFREKLKEKSLYQRILDAILKLFGVVKEDSAYNAANEALAYIIENYDENAFNLYARQAARSQEYSKWYNSEDVRFRMSNENQAIFVSNAARAVEGIKQEKATPEQWLKMIEKNGGLKAGEDKWMGLSDWLKASDKKTLTKAEVLDFINENMIVIEEVHYMGGAEEDFEEAKEDTLYVLQEIYDDYIAESEEMNDDIFMSTHYDYAIQKLAERLGYEAWNAPFVNFNATIRLDLDSEFAAVELNDIRERLGMTNIKTERGINETRLGYTTDGLSNKHEIALTVPTIESWNESDGIHFGDAGDGRAIAWIRFGDTTIDNEVDRTEEIEKAKAEYLAYTDSLKKKYDIVGYGMNTLDEKSTTEEKETYSAMFSKINELQKEHGKKISVNKQVLVIDEIQSKRHQEGRERGYRTSREDVVKATEAFQSFNRAMKEKYGENVYPSKWSEKDQAEFDRLRDEHARVSKSYNKGIPDAPFDKNWHELAMKRMLRYAAEKGYDVIAWTKGEQQASRYDLSKMVKKISVYPSKDGSRIVNLHLVDRENDFKNLVVDSEGMVTFGEYKGRALADVVGKDYSMKIMAATRNTEFSGDNLQVGGEGMRGFYDKMLPAFMNKYGKKWGIKVEDITLPNVEEAGRVMHSVPVTEDMKASVMEGQTMFRARGEDESAEEFVNSMISDFNRKYVAHASISALDPSSKKDLADFFGVSADDFSDEDVADIIAEIEEHDGRGWHNPDINKIAIFVRESVKDGKKTELVISHENIHAVNKKYPDFLALGEYLWNKVEKGSKEYKYKTEIANRYQQDDWYDEMLAYVVSEHMQDGTIAKLEYILDLENTNRLHKLLKTLGYGEDGPTERKRRFGDVLRKRLGRKGSRAIERERGEDNSGDLRFRATEITPEVRDEMDAIAATAIVDGNYMKAPNGADTNLTPEQWTMVRTKAFKAWFGDWELPYKMIDIVRGTMNHGFANFDEARRWAKDNIVRLYGNEETGGKGEIEISNNAVKKYLSESAVQKSDSKNLHLAVMKVLPSVIRNGVIAETHADYMKDENGERTAESSVNPDVTIHRVYGAVRIGDNIYRVKVTLKEHKDANRANTPHSYEATKIELLAGTLVGAKGSNPNTNNSISAANLLKGVEKSYESGKYLLDDYSKVVDENGEPRVMYHGSAWQPLNEPARQAVFKMNDGILGEGAYFASSLTEATMYAEMSTELDISESGNYEILQDEYVTDYFLNIRNAEDIMDQGDGEIIAVAKSPSQIKSATDNTGEFSEGEGDIRFRAVTDPAKIEELENGPKIKVYRAMQLIDGKLYPPMSAKVDGKLREPIKLGQWEEAEERPDLADDKGYFKLDKANKKSLKARYNPYFHTSYTPLNDQFSEAQDRPNLVTVEVEIPASELTSGYKADKAKDSVGEKEWKAGVIQGKLSGTRKVILSRWDKPVRIVPDSEVADVIVKMLEGRDIVMPSNVVTPSLRAELEKRGVPFAETDNKGKPISEFGPIYEQFRGKPKEAVEFLMEKKTGEAVGALNHKDIGDISMVYGNEKAGLKKIAVKHPEVLDILQDILDDATIVQQSENRIKLESDRYFAVISKDYLGKPRSPWLLTSFEKKNSVPDNTMDTGETSKGSKQNDTATLQDTVSESKDSDNIDTSNELDENTSFRVTGTPTEDVVAEGVSPSPAQLASLAGDIFAALPEDSRKKITDGLNGNILGLQEAILQIPTSLATKENWNDEDRQMAEVVAEQMTKAVGIEMTRPFSASEALWTLYNAVNKSTDLVSEASRALVRRNLGFDSQTLEMEKDARDGVRFRTVGDASANAQASMYNRGAASARIRLKESFVDMNASVEELVKAIEKRSGKVAEGFENILMALNQQSSKGLAAMEAYEQKFLNKMFDEIRKIMDKTDFKYEDIVRYVILKHGLERNVKMAQRDAKAHYQEIYDDIISKIKGMNPAQKRTYLTNAQLRDADAKAELARLQAVNTSALTPDQLREHKKELAKAKKEATEAAEHLVRAQKIATMTEQDAQDELDKIFKKIEKGTDSIYKEMRKNDYSGISSMFYDTLGVNRKDYETEEEYQSALMQAKADKYDNLGDIEGAAQTEVTLFENAVNTDNLWKSINKATKETLRQQYDANMISKDQYLNLRDMFEYYVPLRGFADNTAEDMYTYYRRPNSTGYTKPILGAEGRKTEAESPFGWIAAMAGSAIASNVKNEAKLALYYFVANRPDNGIATLSKTWFVHTPGDVDANGKKIFRPAYPPFSEDLSSASAKADYEVWQANMKNLQAQGLAYEAGQRLNLGNSVVNISDTNKPEHIVNVKVGGKDYTIVINGNPRAAQAINGDLNIEGTSQDYGKLFGPILRWMSSVNTSYNPEFWITNMMRDLAFTIMAVNIKGDAAYRRKFKKNYLKAFKVVILVAKNEKGTIGDSYLEQQYKDFVKYGGVTGYTQIKDSETWEKEIENYLSSNDPESLRNGMVMRGMKSTFHAFHRFGESLEQVSRFAAFLTARETGKSINDAIDDAKEITVNFNRKGSGKMISLEEAKYLTDNKGRPLKKWKQWMVVGLSSIAPLGRRFIMFFNAAIQGLNATYKLWKKNPKRFAGWAAAYTAVGAMNAILHAMMDDDDDYLDIPQYERRNSLMIGGNGAYFKWALPQEARAFYALGDLAVETAMRRNPHQNVVGEALKIGTEVLPVNPSEGWKAFMPSLFIPAIELMLNEDYKGAPIYNEQKWLSKEERERTAKWSSAYQGTGWMYVKIAQGLNYATGGDKYDAGLINIQPEKLEHLVQSALGGTIRTADKFVTTVIAAIDPEEEWTIRQTPFLNRFLTINDERFKNVHVNDVFNYYKADAEHTITLEKKYVKDKDTDALARLRSSDEYQWAKIYNKYKKPIKNIREKIKVADGTAEKKELMRQQDELKKAMIKEISEL